MQKSRLIYLDTEFNEFATRGGRVKTELLSMAMIDGPGHAWGATSNAFNKVAAQQNEFVAAIVMPLLDPPAHRKSLKQIKEEALAFIGNEPAQMVYWVSPKDMALLGGVLGDDWPDNLAREGIDLWQVWQAAGAPHILPDINRAWRHCAAEDARWLRQADINIGNYRDSLRFWHR